jgi:hypothetical protein
LIFDYVMDTVHSRPRQVRREDAGPQELLGAVDPTERAPQVSLQLSDVFRCAIGQVMLELAPDELVGIQLGGIGREPVNVQPRVPAQEHLHVVTLVNRPAVPEQFHGPAEVPKEVAKKHDHLRFRDVVGMNVHVQAEAGALGETDTAEMADRLSRV